MLFLPENCCFLGRSPAESLAMAESVTEGEIISKRFASIARRHGVWISVGGFQEAMEGNRTADHRLYNCHIIVDSNGVVRSTYRKIHLFDVDIPNGPKLRESSFTAPGHGLTICDASEIGLGTLGLSVCYDLRFPELYQQLRFRMGADILLVPSAFTVETGQAHWQALLKARAIETQCYVVAAAQTGHHNEKRQTYGHSMIVDPWGTVVASLENAPGLLTAEIDLDKVRDVRMKMPLAMHRENGRNHFDAKG